MTAVASTAPKQHQNSQEVTVFAAAEVNNSSHQTQTMKSILGIGFRCRTIRLFSLFFLTPSPSFYPSVLLCVSCSSPVAWNHMKGGHEKFSFLCWVRSKDPLRIWKELQRERQSELRDLGHIYSWTKPWDRDDASNLKKTSANNIRKWITQQKIIISSTVRPSV